MIGRAAGWWTDGGPVMVPLLLLGLFTYALIAERLFALYGPYAAAEVTTPGGRRRGLVVLRALVSAAPLLGLLGTVVGMISSFEGLVHGGRIADISRGISEALHTTQYGLALAVPGLVAERIISRRSQHLERAQVEAEAL